MFKDLIAFMENNNGSEEHEPTGEVEKFIVNIEKFAFYDDLKDSMARYGQDIMKLIENKKYKEVIDFLLGEKGLNYKSLPKAMLKFHYYDDNARKAFEEHFVEGANYCRESDGNVSIHFTLPDENYDEIVDEINRIKDKYEKLFGVKYELAFSKQKPSTDIIAVDLSNNPFRDKDGRLVFRPGGHGALIENLNDCDSDIIFIKNIDNIVPDRLKANTYLYKKALCGMIIKLQQKLAQYLEMLESNTLSEDIIKEIEEFSEKNLDLRIDAYYRKYTRVDKIKYLYFLLNRPLRVCGMVRNTGEPGGGPFWIKETSGAETLQIVETSQINFDDKEQSRIFKRSTHFNPVDIICFVKDYKGSKFNLNEFIDENTGFISIKHKDGKDLKAQELPGLWNGAMSDWITLFVEVPLITFNPVKTINDLLRQEHQPETITN
jgi:hypothetical protein